MALLILTLTLTLFAPDDQSSGDHLDPKLAGEWIVELIAGSPVPGTARVTVNFREDGRTITGQGPCNTYRTTYTAEGALLKVGPVMSTMMVCSDTVPPPPGPGGPGARVPAVMALERDFLAIISTAASYEIRPDGALVLTANDERRVVAKRP